jgi:hypothetical protein
MKLPSLAPRGLLAVCLLGSVAALGACSSETEPAGDGDATGGAASDGTGGTIGDAAGGTAGDGDATGGAAAADPNELPADNSQASIEAFLAAGTYKNPPWVGDPEIRLGDLAGNVHGDHLRVHFNSAAVASKASGGPNSGLGTMVVKEMFDAAGVSLGKAVQMKTGPGNTKEDWTYYCSGPDGSLCAGGAFAVPIYGEGLPECGYCHGQMPYADPPL